MTGFSFRRFLAVLRKEWIQMRRDPTTIALTVAVPLMQLFLFGYAINANPRHLPTGVLSADHSRYERTLTTALAKPAISISAPSRQKPGRAGPGAAATCCSC